MTQLTRAQVREIDRLSIGQYHIPGIVLMENAARATADVACEMLGNARGRQILILCGGGNNGGDGLAVARHLHNRGANISIALTIDPAKYHGDALINWQIVSAMRLPCHPALPETIAQSSADLLIDAIFGTGLTAPPRDPFPALVEAVEKSARPVLAIDLPSGLDCDTGHPPGACIRATRTITFVAEKIGFAAPSARPYLGAVTIGDIGCPAQLITQIASDSIPTAPSTASGDR
jgi:NAD(P)H-hydrate epimerase